jgi:hypothetical protein
MISEECNDWAGVYKVQTFGTTQKLQAIDNFIGVKINQREEAQGVLW